MNEEGSQLIEQEAPATLRDVIEGAVNDAEQTQAPDTRTAAERARDEKGRFAAANEKPDADASKNRGPSAAQTPSKPARPSTWKKDFEQHWEKLSTGAQLTPDEANALVGYLGQREQDYAKGVSTYKQEWEQAKPLIEAMTPFMPLLQQHGIQPQQWIANLGNAHRVLALGSPQDKLNMFAQLAREYQVPLQALVPQQSAQFNPLQYVNPLYQRLQQLETKIQSDETQKAAQEQARVNSEIEAFSKDASYPHFEQVRDKMAGLLQAGLADDLKGAYEQAIRLNDDIWQQEQQRLRDAAATEQRQSKAQAASRARASAISPRSTTPTAAAGGNSGKKDVRSSIVEAFEAHESGRV